MAHDAARLRAIYFGTRRFRRGDRLVLTGGHHVTVAFARGNRVWVDGARGQAMFQKLALVQRTRVLAAAA